MAWATASPTEYGGERLALHPYRDEYPDALKLEHDHRGLPLLLPRSCSRRAAGISPRELHRRAPTRVPRMLDCSYNGVTVKSRPAQNCLMGAPFWKWNLVRSCSPIYALVHSNRVQENEIDPLSAHLPFDVGTLHNASDTPYSPQQRLLSKRLSYFVVDTPYACGIAILRRIFE